jgi:hypothetical protein
MFAEHKSGAADHGRLLYALVVFAMWWEDAQTHVRGHAANAAA